MARANRHHIPGQVWHITHRCHKREFLLKFSKDRSRWIRSLGNWNPEGVIVIEFQSEDQIQNWLKSLEYAAVAPLREVGADAQAIIIEGYHKD